LSASLFPSSVNIRKMMPADLERVIEIDRLSFSLPWPERSFHFEVEKNEAARAWIAEAANDDGTTVLVGMIVGWLILDEIHVATIATDPAFRKQGIGRQLMVHLLREAYKEGARISFLEVRRGNEAAREMYRSLGYQEDGVRPRYYQDNHEDAILMSLREIDPDLFDSQG
jgi:[ribosomal protein S18]-alanine N-acetyltransferase